MKNLLYIPIVALLFSCGGAKPVATTDEDLYGVLNALLSNQAYIDAEDLVLDELRVINESDIEYIARDVGHKKAAQLLQQAKDSTAIKLDTKRIKGGYRWFPSEKEKEMFNDGYYSGWEPLLKEYGERSYCIISKPLFSDDHTVAVVAIRKKNDWRMGSGGTYLLKKINGKWRFKGKIGGWIS